MRFHWVLGALALWLTSASNSWAAAPKFVLPEPVVVAPLAAGSAVQPVSFARAAFQLADGKIWAYEGGIITCGALWPSPLKWRAGDWELDTPRLKSIFREELAEAGFARAANVNLFDDQATSDRFQVAALITDMDSRFCGLFDSNPPYRYTGRMRMSVEWQLYDTLRREVVARIQTTAGGEEKKLSLDGVENTFFAAFRQSVRALLASVEFRSSVADGNTDTRAPVLTPITFRPESLSRRPVASSAEAVVAVFAGEGHGTGFLVAPEGYILTNRHVVGGAKFVKIRWPDRSETVGEVIRSDRRRDVALVKADAGGRKPLAIRSAGAGLGETVFAIGTPLDQKFQGTVTKGVVSANRTYDGLNFIQSDVTVNAGNSGGPLIDESGAVIGLTVSGYQVNGAPAGINLFIPIADALASLALRPAS